MFKKNDIIKLDNNNEYVIYYKYENYLYLVNVLDQEEMMIVQEIDGELEEVIEQEKIEELLKKLTNL